MITVTVTRRHINVLVVMDGQGRVVRFQTVKGNQTALAVDIAMLLLIPQYVQTALKAGWVLDVGILVSRDSKFQWTAEIVFVIQAGLELVAIVNALVTVLL